MYYFIDFMNKRYGKVLKLKELKPFRYWDDYAIFLFEDLCREDVEKYYELLEKDIKMYSDYQTGVERENEHNAKN